MGAEAIIKEIIFSGAAINQPISTGINKLLPFLDKTQTIAALAIIYASAVYLTIFLAEKNLKPAAKAAIIAASAWLTLQKELGLKTKRVKL